MTTAQVVETSVIANNNSPISDYAEPDDHAHPTYRAILKKIGEKKDKLPRFLHRIRRARTEQGLRAFLLCINHYKFLKIHKLKINIAFLVFWW